MVQRTLEKRLHHRRRLDTMNYGQRLCGGVSYAAQMRCAPGSRRPTYAEQMQEGEKIRRAIAISEKMPPLRPEK